LLSGVPRGLVAPKPGGGEGGRELRWVVPDNVKEQLVSWWIRELVISTRQFSKSPIRQLHVGAIRLRAARFGGTSWISCKR